MNFDPSSEDMEQTAIDAQFTALKYEDRLKLRASLVLDAYKRQLEDINVSALSYQDKERYERVQNLLEYLESVKVVDAPVLLKIYNMYRCSLWFKWIEN